MGSYKIGSECCNNCVHWDAERDSKHGEGMVFSYKNCAKCTSSYSPWKGRATLSENCCPYFSHIWGITKTFSIKASNGQKSADSTADVLTSTYTQALLAELENRVAIRDAEKTAAQESVCAEQTEPEEDLDGDDEAEFRMTMEELGRAQRRGQELLKEGLAPKSFLKDKSVEFMHLLDRARNGNVNAQYTLGKAFFDGSFGAWELQSMSIDMRHIPYDWLRKAAKRGHVGALYLLGRTEFDGVEKSFEYLSRAAAKGHVEAKRELRTLYEKLVGKSKDYLKGCVMLAKNDKQGTCHKEMLSKIRSASNELKDEWGEGIPLYKLDPCFVKQCASALSEYALRCSVEMQNTLGKMYGAYKGFDYIVEPDAEHAVVWFLRAATSGCLDAMKNLGNCYKNGQGVVEDKKLAVTLYLKAARKGLAEAQNMVARCAEEGWGMKEDAEVAFFWKTRAAESGHATAMNDLANFYSRGYGCEKNSVKESEWRKRAEEHGYSCRW